MATPDIPRDIPPRAVPSMFLERYSELNEMLADVASMADYGCFSGDCPHETVHGCQAATRTTVRALAARAERFLLPDTPARPSFAERVAATYKGLEEAQARARAKVRGELKAAEAPATTTRPVFPFLKTNDVSGWAIEDAVDVKEVLRTPSVQQAPEAWKRIKIYGKPRALAGDTLPSVQFLLLVRWYRTDDPPRKIFAALMEVSTTFKSWWESQENSKEGEPS